VIDKVKPDSAAPLCHDEEPAMVTRIRAPKDFWTGVVYFVVGVLGILIGREYSFGSTGRMGPGYFPFVISCLLIAFGVISIIQSLRVPGEPVGSFAWKPILLIVGAVFAFGLLINTAGLIVAMLVLVLMSAAASERFQFEWMPLLGLAVLVAFCSLVFVMGLGVPMPLFGSWFGG
jgi:hypothetical protein